MFHLLTQDQMIGYSFTAASDAVRFAGTDEFYSVVKPNAERLFY